MRCTQLRSRGIRHAVNITALSFLGGLFLVPAHAQTLTITAKGVIQGSCGISVQSAFGSANLDADGSATGSALVNCNTPYRIRATSTNGAMKAATIAPPQFSNSLDYNLTVAVPLDVGGQISATCASPTLAVGQTSCALSPASSNGLSSGTGTSTSKTASLTVQWTLPTVTRLVAGNYADVLTITIAPQQ